MVEVSHLTPAGLPGQEGPAERRWRQRGRPSSSARRARTLQLPAESVETSPRSTLLRMGRSPPAEGEDQQRLRQRAVRKVAMRQFRLRRWAVTAALRSKRGALAEGEDPQRLRQRAVREVEMRLFRLRRWAVTAILDTKVGAAAAAPTPAAPPEPPVPGDALSSANATGGEGRQGGNHNGIGGSATAMADASAAGGGKAIATAVATSIAGTAFTLPRERQCNVERRDCKGRDGSSAVDRRPRGLHPPCARRAGDFHREDEPCGRERSVEDCGCVRRPISRQLAYGNDRCDRAGPGPLGKKSDL